MDGNTKSSKEMKKNRFPQDSRRFWFVKRNNEINAYRTRANKRRGLYSKNIFWAIIAAINQERLLFENNFFPQYSNSPYFLPI